MHAKLSTAYSEMIAFLSDKSPAISFKIATRILLFMYLFCISTGVILVNVIHQEKVSIGWHVPLVEHWVKNGIFHSAGLTIYQSTNTPTDRYIYKTSTPWCYYPIYILQKALYHFRGNTSMKLWFVQNFVVWVSGGAALGFLVFCILTRACTLCTAQRLAFSFLAASVYLTHPVVFYQLIFTCHEQIALAIILFLVALETYQGLEQSSSSRLINGVRPFLVFALTGTSYDFSVLYVLIFCFVSALRRSTPPNVLVKGYILPMALVLIVGQVQYTLASMFLDNIAGFVGSSFRYRSGLDGASNIMKGGYWSLFSDRIPAIANSCNWISFFIFGSLATLVAFFISLRDKKMTVWLHATLPLAMFGIVFHFVLAQGVIIHPYAYDPLIVVPLVLGLFGGLSGFAENYSKQNGAILCLMTIVGICFCMIHLRAYALDFPDPDPGWFPHIAGLIPG